MRGVDRVLRALAESPRSPSSWLVGDPCAAPPAALHEAFSRAAAATRYPYPPAAGRPSLRLALAELHANEGATISADQVAVTAGAKPGLFAVLAALLEPGDELIHPQPCYPGYPAMAAAMGVKATPVEQRGISFGEWIDRIEPRIGPATRAVVLSSPSNPTGATFAGSEASRLLEVCRRHGVRLICDEAYHEFRFAGTLPAIPADFDNDRQTVVQIRSASKTWAVCGWRIGWVVADPDLARRVASCHVSLFGPAPGPPQNALEHLHDIDPSYHVEARATVQRRFDRVTEALESDSFRALRPPGGFYLWLDVGHLMEVEGIPTATAWCEELARRTGVGLWPGDDFGGPRHARIAVTAPGDPTWEDDVAALAGALAAHGSGCNGGE